MRIVNAVWEKRNLGVDCIELSIDVKDCKKTIENNLDKMHPAEYEVVRIPSERIDIVQLFQNRGYSFIEAAIKLTNNIQKTQIPKKLVKICNNVSWEAMSEKDLDFLYSEIDKNIFKTDRISLDPFFSSQQASQRYKNWIKDLVNAGNIPYKVIYNDKVIGFFLNKKIETDVFDGILAGTYSDYEGSGMGVCVQYAGLKHAKDLNATKYIGHVSANNPAVLKALVLIGFEIKQIEYILIKHN